MCSLPKYTDKIQLLCINISARRKSFLLFLFFPFDTTEWFKMFAHQSHQLSKLYHIKVPLLHIVPLLKKISVIWIIVIRVGGGVSVAI